MPVKKSKKRHVIVRGINSGCFAGEFVSRTGTEVKLKNCRRLWHWAGAATLSELAQRGTSKPAECKFPAPTENHEILDACEVIDMSLDALNSINAVKPWSA